MWSKRRIECQPSSARAHRQIELRAFKSANDIVSLERGENRELAALKGLNDSLNKARERLIEARARKAAIDDAIARGEMVVPNEQKAAIARMRVQVERMRGRLAELREKYTDLYLERGPAYKDLPAEFEEHQKALLTALEVGRITERDEAQQALESARLSVATLQEQLESDQVRVQQFTERFNDYKVLEDGLASLQQLAVERGERLAQIEVQNHLARLTAACVPAAHAAGRCCARRHRRADVRRPGR